MVEDNNIDRELNPLRWRSEHLISRQNKRAITFRTTCFHIAIDSCMFALYKSIFRMSWH